MRNMTFHTPYFEPSHECDYITMVNSQLKIQIKVAVNCNNKMIIIKLSDNLLFSSLNRQDRLPEGVRVLILFSR